MRRDHLRVARLLAIIGLAITAVVLAAALGKIGVYLPDAGSILVLVAAGISPGLVATALVLLASPPPRTPWLAHALILVLVTGAVIFLALGGIGNGSAIDAAENGEQPPLIAVLGTPLLVPGLVLAAAAIGLLAAQVSPPSNRWVYASVVAGPALLALVLAVVPESSAWLRDLAIAASNLAIGAMFIAPVGAMVALVLVRDRLAKQRAAEARTPS